METKVNRNFEREGEFAHLLSKRMRNQYSLSVGFEWEIPFSVDQFDDPPDDYDLGEYLEDEPGWAENYARCYRRHSMDQPFMWGWLDKLGYISHIECGGLEVGSPVFPSIDMARAHARYIISEARKMYVFHMTGNEEPWNDCGIHVHVRDDRQGMSCNITGIVSAMLNRHSSADFVWDISGRGGDAGYYSDQARSNCWDTNNYERTFFDAWGNDMCQHNTGPDTMELRMFGSSADRLIPAIEMGHSLYRFVQKRYSRLLEYNSFCELIDCNTDYLKKIPYLVEWKEWLGKQPGYKVLKAEPSLNLI